MNYIIIPYFYDHIDTHFLPINWIPINKKCKMFLWHDSLFTVQMIYTKNNVQVYIHNTDFYYIAHSTFTSIKKATLYIEVELSHIINCIILKNKFCIGDLHDIHLYKLYDLVPSSTIDDNDYPF